MKTRLFNENDRYSEAGLNLSNEAEEAIEPIMKKWADKGFSIRDIEYIIKQAALDTSLDYLLSH